MEVRGGPSGDFYVSGLYDFSTLVEDFPLNGTSLGTILARYDAETGRPLWATGLQDGGDSRFGQRRFVVAEDESVHFTLSTAVGPGTVFGTNRAPMENSGHVIHLMRVDGETGALERERVIGVEGVATLHSGCLAFLDDETAIVAGNFNLSGNFLGLPFGHPARDGYDHYVMQVARLE